MQIFNTILTQLFLLSKRNQYYILVSKCNEFLSCDKVTRDVITVTTRHPLLLNIPPSIKHTPFY